MNEIIIDNNNKVDLKQVIEIRIYYEEIIQGLEERINKAIEYIENHIVATETEDILLKILKGSEPIGKDN